MSRQSVLGVSPIHYLCVLQHHVSAAIVSPVCHRLLVEASTRSRNLVKPRQNTVRALSEYCQSTVRALPGSHPHQVMYRQVVLSVSSKVILGASSNRLRGTPLPFSSLVTVSSSLFHLVPFVMMSHNLPPNAFKSPFKPLLKLRAFLLLVQRSFRSL